MAMETLLACFDTFGLAIQSLFGDLNNLAIAEMDILGESTICMALSMLSLFHIKCCCLALSPSF